MVVSLTMSLRKPWLYLLICAVLVGFGCSSDGGAAVELVDSGGSQNVEDGTPSPGEDVGEPELDVESVIPDATPEPDAETQSDVAAVDTVGACCGSGGGCEPLTKAECQNQGGSWNPGACADAGCPEPELTAACCLPSGSCMDLDAVECTGKGGTLNPGATCSETECVCLCVRCVVCVCVVCAVCL